MPAELGSKIRAARAARGLSLRATAADASISPSLLSQVETGKVQPSVSTLYAIVTSLGLSIDDVLGQRAGSDAPRPSGRVEPVQKWDAGPEIRMENGVAWRGLAAMGDVDSLHVTYAPGAASSLDDSHMRHDGIEHGFIIRGEMTLKLDFDTYALRAGDSFCFDSTRPHYFFNHSDAVAEGIWFVTGRGRTQSHADAGDGVMRSAVDVLEAMSRLPGRIDE